MPDRTPCLRCRKIGFVRSEHVVRGGEAMVAFACGACGYSWQRPEGSEEARQATASPKPGAKPPRPKAPLRRKG